MKIILKKLIGGREKEKTEYSMLYELDDYGHHNLTQVLNCQSKAMTE